MKNIIIIIMILLFLLPSPLFAEGLSLIQKIKYKVASVMDPTGQETVVLVNRFTDEVEYSWAVNGWMKAPPHIKHCYKNQHSIRSMVNQWRWRRRRKK